MPSDDPRRRPRPPRIPGVDHSLALLREGYRFISNRCDLHGTPIFRTRIMARPVICMRGIDAANFFYAEDCFTRTKAMPVTVLKLLQDFGSVQLLNGNEHRHRKRMFLLLADSASVAALCRAFRDEWHERISSWERSSQIVLFDELRGILTRAACGWGGVPLSHKEAASRTLEFSEMIESTGSFGPRNWRALWLRRRSEKWARTVIAEVRKGRRAAAAASALHTVSFHRNPGGDLLDVEAAAVELLNVLRAVMAVARFIVFAAAALQQHPEWRERIRSDEELTQFVQEVRRLAPFFPFIAGRSTRTLEWAGYGIAVDDWVILDLYGTNRDPAVWTDPERFDPARFSDPKAQQALVPQGAGDTAATHRCPGEDSTVALMKSAMRLMTESVTYRAPAQDLSLDLAQIPALPHSGYVMTDIRRSSAA